jgi:hypothetical protein
MNNTNRSDRFEFDLGSSEFQNLFGLLRLILFFGILLYFGVNYSQRYDDVIPVELAARYKNLPPFVAIAFAAIINPSSLRYMILPLLATILMISAGAYYVKDMYALPSLSKAFHYILSSMFSLLYPKLIIDGGKRKLKKGETSLIDDVGGPGFVLIEPGSGAIFRHLRRPADTLVSTTHFVAPFETISQTIDLAEQQADRDQIPAITRDGIRVTLRDVHFRYMIMQQAPRTIENAYPFAQDALWNRAFNLNVQSDGLDKWNTAVERVIVGFITDFIASHSIDYLTAPRSDLNSRREILSDLFASGARSALRRIGAELYWIDIGHLEIDDPLVDDQRAQLWASEWIGDTAVSRAYSDAIHQTYEELGRAQAQAELIMGISEAMRSVPMGPNTTANIRRILLARTTQLLDALAEKYQSNQENQTGAK